DSLKDIISKRLVIQNDRYQVAVTDAAGEARDEENSYSVSNYKNEVSVIAEYDVKTDTPLQISIRSNEVNGDFAPVTGYVKIYRTLPRKRFFENRSWEIPVMQSIDETTSISLFPHESYTNDDLKIEEEQLV